MGFFNAITDVGRRSNVRNLANQRTLETTRGQLLFGLTSSQSTEENLIFFANRSNIRGGLFTQGLLLRPSNRVNPPRLDAYAIVFLKKLSFNAQAGTFKGSYTFLNPPNPKFNRTATFEGILPNQVSSKASGFYLLPDLPPLGHETLKTTAIQSGAVEIEAKSR